MRRHVDVRPVAARGYHVPLCVDDEAVGEHSRQPPVDAVFTFIDNVSILWRGRHGEPVAQGGSNGEVVVQPRLGFLHGVLSHDEERLEPLIVFAGEVGQVGLGDCPLPQDRGVPLQVLGRRADLV